MTHDKQDLLAVLTAELEFLKKGGYRHPARATWRPQFVFQDSPTCINADPTHPPKPCSECPLMRFIPEDAAGKQFPCRYIPLNDRGETVASLYRYATQEELEAVVEQWLRATIQCLQKYGRESTSVEKPPEVEVRAGKG
jgi:hypothetical protein